MDRNIKLIIAAVGGLLLLAAASAILVSNTRKARDIVDWQPAPEHRKIQLPQIEEAEEAEGIQGSWAWKETVYNNDTKDVPAGPTFFVIAFHENGSFASTTDCNNLVGSFELEDNSIKITKIGSTLMACEDSSLQDEYMKSLQDAASYFIDDEGRLVLELPYDTGSMIFEQLKF